MPKDIFKWLIDKGLVLATLLINITSASITLIVMMIILVVDDWVSRNIQ